MLNKNANTKFNQFFYLQTIKTNILSRELGTMLCEQDCLKYFRVCVRKKEAEMRVQSNRSIESMGVLQYAVNKYCYQVCCNSCPWHLSLLGCEFSSSETQSVYYSLHVMCKTANLNKVN